MGDNGSVSSPSSTKRSQKQLRAQQSFHESRSKRHRYICVGVMTTMYVVAEIAVAVYLDSLALLSDGFHNFGDLVALAIAYWCEQNKSRMAGVHYTYGFKRVEILGGLANGWSLMALCLYVVLESIPRFYHHIEIQGGATFITIAALGLAVNTIGTIIFARHGMSHGHSHGGHGHDHDGHGKGDHELLTKPPGKKKESKPGKADRYGGTLDEASTTTSYFSAPSEYPSDDDHHDEHHGHEHHGHAHHDLNMRAVFLHYLGDSISSVAVLIEGILLSVLDGDWLQFIDPIFSLIIVCIIVATTYPLLKQCSLLVLQVCPVDIDGVRRQLSSVQGVISVHELHIWTLTPGVVISTLHFATLPTANVKGIQCEMRKILHHAGVHSSAIQVEYVEIEQKDAHKSTSCIENCVVDCDQEWCCDNDSDEL